MSIADEMKVERSEKMLLLSKVMYSKVKTYKFNAKITFFHWKEPVKSLVWSF